MLKKPYFRSKIKKVSINIEICIIDLIQVPHFTLSKRINVNTINLNLERQKSAYPTNSPILYFKVYIKISVNILFGTRELIKISKASMQKITKLFNEKHSWHDVWAAPGTWRSCFSTENYGYPNERNDHLKIWGQW